MCPEVIHQFSSPSHGDFLAALDVDAERADRVARWSLLPEHVHHLVPPSEQRRGLG
jgi:hypothetical protein